MTAAFDAHGGNEADRETDGFVQGLSLATVTDNEDPDGLARVRVHLPWQAESEETFWARLIMPMAGPEQGIQFVPEVGDHVIVAFEGGDVTHPCVLGSVWHGNRKPPDQNDDKKNDVRVIRTRSNSELRFFDGDPPSLELKLKDKGRLFMDDKGITLEDRQGNTVKIESQSGAITITSKNDLKLAAKQISIEAETKVAIKSKGELTINGNPVRIN